MLRWWSSLVLPRSQNPLGPRNKRIFMSQEHYLASILDRFDMTNCKPAKVPLPHGFKPRSATLNEFEEVKDEPYQAMVGSLLYAATITRPDIAFAASLLARHASRWNSSHLHAAQNLLWYIKGTLDLCLAFDPCGRKCILLGYADADWGGCLETRQSMTGYVIKVFGGIVAWRSKQQPTTALLTMEAKYMSSSGAA